MKARLLRALVCGSALSAGRAHALEAPDVTPNIAGARLGVEATPVASVYYARFGRGLWQPRAETELDGASAVLTGWRGGRLRIERREPLVRAQRFAVLALLGTGVAFARDAGGRYRAWSGLLGLQATRAVASWELGVRLAYLPILASHVEFSPQLRDTFADRYPDARNEPGPSDATIWFSSQRLQALALARALWTGWALDLTAGLQWSPRAGRDWANIEAGQLPILLQFGLGRRF
jgi:hypothetical protein